MDSKRWASTLVDEALVAAMVPWACPCDFGPEGRFRLEELISLGRRSLVYKGVDKRLSSDGFSATVAVKIASTPNAGVVDALSARRVVHPNVVRVLDLGTDAESGAEYVVTEFIDGGDLSEFAVPCSPSRAARIVASLARGVQAAHSAGVVHCDLKPANVLMTREGTPKLADFDLCRSPVSMDDAARGNAAFMSPEQAHGGDIGLAPLSDIYALGGILRWLLTGSIDFVRDDVANRFVGSKVNPVLAKISLRAMNPRRELRHSSAAELATDLENWLEHKPIAWMKPGAWSRGRLWLRRNPGRASVLTASAVVLIGTTIIWQRNVSAERQRISFEREQRELAQVKAVKMANQEVESIKARGRAMIKGIMQASGIAPMQPADRMFAQLVIWGSLSDKRLVDDEIRAAMGAERIEMLRTFLREHATAGPEETVQTAFARYSLAQLLIATDQSELAQAELAKVRAWVNTRFDANDPFLHALAVLEAAAAFDGTAVTEEVAKARLASLNRSIEAAERIGDCDEACEVAREVLKRHRIP